jgi:hypothetical protein
MAQDDTEANHNETPDVPMIQHDMEANGSLPESENIEAGKSLMFTLYFGSHPLSFQIPDPGTLLHPQRMMWI